MREYLDKLHRHARNNAALRRVVSTAMQYVNETNLRKVITQSTEKERAARGSVSLPANVSRSMLKGKRIVVIGSVDPTFLGLLSDLATSVSVWFDDTQTFADIRVRFPAISVRHLEYDRSWHACHHERFDLAIASDVLHRVRDPLALLQFVSTLAPQLWIDCLAISNGSTLRPVLRVDNTITNDSNPSTGVSFGWIKQQLNRLNFDLTITRPAKDTGVPEQYYPGEGGNVDQQDNGTARRYLLVAHKMDVYTGSAPVIIHVHVPKNGGTTLQHLLDESFGDEHIPMYTTDPRKKHPYHAMLEVLYRNTNAKALSSHSFNFYPPLIGLRIALYVSFLRNPINRHVSYYRYCRKNWASLSEEHRAMMPKNFADMSLVDFFKWQSEEDRRLGISPNRQVQYFARTNSLGLAKAILGEFFFVGVTEELDRGIALLNRKLEPYDLQLKYTASARKDNATRDLYAETEQYMRDPVVQRYLKSISSDRTLYDWAKDRFETEAARYCV